MTMRRIWMTAAAILLLGAGVAVAHNSKAKSVKEVSATFLATTVSKTRTTTCTAADGTYATTRATYTGTSTSAEPTLTGTASIDAESLVNTTTGLGLVSGKLTITAADGKRAHLRFSTVLAAGAIAGFAEGEGHKRDYSKVLGNLSATYSAAGGFTNGKLGGGTTGGAAVQIVPGGCRAASPEKPERVEVEGKITAISPTSISAAGVTCVVPAELQPKLTGLVVGDPVELECTVAGGVNTLAKVSKDGGNHKSKHDRKRNDKR
jgi:hypothetical protein